MNLLSSFCVSAACVLAALPSLALADAPGVECWVTCVSGTCELDRAPSGVEKSPRLRLIDRCLSAKLVSEGSALVVMFQSGRGLERFAVGDKHRGVEFAQVEPRLKLAKCMNSLLCLESRDQARVAGVGGKGIDATASLRVGSPCALGLPCGTILRPAGQQQVLLADPGLQGQLQLRAQRGAAGSLSLPVVQGALTLPEGFLVAGAAYAYALQDAAGVQVAAGEFEVLSSKMQADVLAELDALQKAGGPTLALDRAELLYESKLFWNLAQSSR